MKKMVGDKKGAGKLQNVLIWILIGLALVLAIYVIFGDSFGNIFSNLGEGSSSTIPIPVSQILDLQFPGASGAAERALNLVGGVLGFIIGEIPVTGTTIAKGSSGMSSLIVVLCIWAMMALAFGDIFRSLSFFSEGISWGIAVLLAIAAANLGVLSSWLILFTKIFASAGVVAVYIGLLGSFFAFVIIELGIGHFGPWLMKRKAMQAAGKYQAKSILGARKLETTVTSLGTIGEAIKNLGKE